MSRENKPVEDLLARLSQVDLSRLSRLSESDKLTAEESALFIADVESLRLSMKVDDQFEFVTEFPEDDETWEIYESYFNPPYVGLSLTHRETGAGVSIEGCEMLDNRGYSFGDWEIDPE